MIQWIKDFFKSKEEKQNEIKVEINNTFGIGMGWFLIFIGILIIGFKLFTNKCDDFEYVKALLYIIVGFFNKEIFTYYLKKDIETQIKKNLTK